MSYIDRVQRQRIVPHLWFDTEAKEAAAMYVSIFGGESRLGNSTTITNTPSGSVDIVPFSLWGFEFLSISAGPYFKPTPAISFMVNFDPSVDKNAAKNIDEMWAKLSNGGKVMMEIGEYPFSKRYGWVADKFGFSWQLILTNPEGEERPRIIPSMLFVDENYGKAEAASDFYISVFGNSSLLPRGHAKRGAFIKYPSGADPNKEGTIMFSDFKLLDTWIIAMDGGGTHGWKFNEAVSLIVYCDDQKEIDYYWAQLSARPENEQCGWLKDKFGVSWQIVPKDMDDMMATKDAAALDRVTKAFLAMKKFDIATLKKAFAGK